MVGGLQAIVGGELHTLHHDLLLVHSPHSYLGHGSLVGLADGFSGRGLSDAVPGADLLVTRSPLCDGRLHVLLLADARLA